MSTNEKQHYIYLRSTKERIPCTEEEFKNYYHDIDNFRRKQQRHGRCVCPISKQLECDMDCATCPFRRAGDTASLDYTITDADGNEEAWVNTIADPTPLFSDVLAEKEHLELIIQRLKEIMPEAITIGQLREQGLSEDAIAEEIGIGRKTFAYRLKKAKLLLEKEFSDFF